MPARTYAGTDTYTFTRRLTYVQNACWHTYVHVRTPTHVRTSAHIRTPEYIRTSAHVRTAARLCAGSPSWLCPSAGALAASEEYCWVSVLSGRCPPLQCRPGQPADCHHHHTLLLPSAIDCTALRRRRRTKPTSKRAGHCRWDTSKAGARITNKSSAPPRTPTTPTAAARRRQWMRLKPHNDTEASQQRALMCCAAAATAERAGRYASLRNHRTDARVPPRQWRHLPARRHTAGAADERWEQINSPVASTTFG